MDYITVKLRNINKKSKKQAVTKDLKIDKIKDLFQKKTKINKEDFKLYCKGGILDASKTISDYNINDEDVIIQTRGELKTISLHGPGILTKIDVPLLIKGKEIKKLIKKESEGLLDMDFENSHFFINNLEKGNELEDEDYLNSFDSVIGNKKIEGYIYDSNTLILNVKIREGIIDIALLKQGATGNDLYNCLGNDYPILDFNLTFKGVTVNKEKTLREQGIKNGDVIIFNGNIKGGKIN